MRIKTSFIIVFIIFIMAARGAVFAETPNEQLKQMVQQLQKNPTNNALREKIIKLAQELKPAPTLPAEAERFEGRAQFAFKNAKSPADYLDAAKEYEKAIAAAPWVPGYYYDLCTIYEKAEKYAEAKRNCEFFLASSPSAQDANDVRKRIAGLEFAMEKAYPQAIAKQEREAFEVLVSQLNGTVFRSPIRTFSDGAREYTEVRIRGKQLLLGEVVEGECRYRDFGGCFYLSPEIVDLKGYDMQTTPNRGCGGPNDPLSPAYLTLSKDGRAITVRYCDTVRRLDFVDLAK